MTKQERKDATHLIRQAVIAHMPSAAVASGMVSEVSPAAWVESMSTRFPHDARPADLGIFALTEWLRSQGVEAGNGFAKALQAEWRRERMCRAS